MRLSKLHIVSGSSKQGVWNSDEVQGCAYDGSGGRKGMGALYSALGR